jgi:hypothetical protein
VVTLGVEILGSWMFIFLLPLGGIAEIDRIGRAAQPA